MKQLWHDIQDHRPVASIFLVGWVVLWIVSVVTWLYDPAGYSVGMRNEVFYVHLLAPLMAGVVAGWWQHSIRGGIKNGLWAGALFSVLDFAVLIAWSEIQIRLGKADPSALESMAWWEGIAEALHMGLTFAVIGLVIGAMGGMIAGFLILLRRRATSATADEK